MSVTLRTADLCDLDAVMALEEAGFVAGIVEDRAVFSRRISAFPEGFLLAGSPPWGYLCAEIWSGWDEGDRRRFDLGHDIGAYLDRTGDTLYLASMTVAPSHRGAGRGRDLFRAGVDHLTARFPAVLQAVLIVNEHWAGARRLYEAEGFGEVARLSGFFRPTQGPEGAALVMKRETG
jgi:ribosomal protein S18 acetylase RimI-like enzyme